MVEVPKGLTAGGVLDIWQRSITDTGMLGPDQGNAINVVEALVS